MLRFTIFRALLRPFSWSVALPIVAALPTLAATWTPVGPPVWVDSISADQQDPRIVYVSRRNSGIWKTTDGGFTWIPASSGLPAVQRFDIALDPANSSIVYAVCPAYGSPSGVFKTVNGGASWSYTRTGLPGGSTRGIAVSPSNPTDLLVTVGTSLYRSRNAAATWEVVGPGLPPGDIVAVFSPASSSTIFAAVSGPSAGLFRSLDGGSSWSPLSSLPITGMSLKYVGPVAIDPRHPSVIYADSSGCGYDCNGNLYKSDDGGTSWTYAGLYANFASLLVVDGSSAVTASGCVMLCRSTDGGLTWNEFDDGLAGVTGLESSVDRLYAASEAGVFLAMIPAPPGSPFLSGVIPSSGPAAGGAIIGVDGIGFQNGAALKIGGVSALDVSVTSTTQIDAVSPVLTAGTLNDVVVINPNRLSAYLPDGFFADFLDVDQANPFHDFVETLARHKVTAGCGSGGYCPGGAVTRAQVAVMLLRSKESQYYLPPACTSPVFDDVPCSSVFASWVDELAARGVTVGCAAGLYCPGAPVTRAQMAVMLLRTQEGASYVPPAASGIFADVPASSPYAPFIEELARRGITAGCGGGRYCPDSNVTRGQMSVFLAATFFAS